MTDLALEVIGEEIPQNESMKVTLGTICIKKGDLEKARECLYSCKTQSNELTYNKGLLLVKEKQYDEAIIEFLKIENT